MDILRIPEISEQESQEILLFNCIVRPNFAKFASAICVTKNIGIKVSKFQSQKIKALLCTRVVYEQA